MKSSSLTSRSSAWGPDRLLGALGFLASVAFWPGIPSFAEAPKWCVLGVGAALLICLVRLRPTPAHWVLLGILAYAAASILWSVVPIDGVGAWIKLAILAVVFCVAAEQDDLTPAYVGMGLGLGVSAAIAGFQGFGVSPVEQIAPPAGLYGNKNFLAEAAALVTVALVLTPRRRWLALLPAAAIAVTMGYNVVMGQTGCRGAAVAILAAGLVWLWRRMPWVTVGIVIVASAFGIDYVRSDPHRLASLVERFIIWSDTLDGLSWFGHGIGSYYTALPEHGPRLAMLMQARVVHAHNDALELIFEFGLGAVGFVSLLAMALAAGAERERLVLVAFLAAGLTGFPLYESSTAFLAFLVAGNLCGLGYRVGSVVDRGRTHSHRVHAEPGPLRRPPVGAAPGGAAVPI